jgi:RNA polymerase sigma-70 factor (ECF subfamily)
VERTNPEENLLSSETLRELRGALSKLKEDQATVLYLHYFEGLSVADIAASLNLGEENVKTRLFRGRKKLRELLSPL